MWDVTAWPSLEAYLRADGAGRRLVATSARRGAGVHRFAFSDRDSLLFGRNPPDFPPKCRPRRRNTCAFPSETASAASTCPPRRALCSTWRSPRSAVSITGPRSESVSPRLLLRLRRQAHGLHLTQIFLVSGQVEGQRGGKVAAHQTVPPEADSLPFSSMRICCMRSSTCRSLSEKRRSMMSSA